jgi:hypothetical protein
MGNGPHSQAPLLIFALSFGDLIMVVQSPNIRFLTVTSAGMPGIGAGNLIHAFQLPVVDG